MSTKSKAWTIGGGVVALLVVGLLVWFLVAAGARSRQAALDNEYAQAAGQVTVSAQALAVSLDELAVLDDQDEVFVSGMETLNGAVQVEGVAFGGSFLDEDYLAGLDAVFAPSESQSGQSGSQSGGVAPASFSAGSAVSLVQAAGELGLLPAEAAQSGDAQSGQSGEVAQSGQAQSGAVELVAFDPPEVVTREDVDALLDTVAQLDQARVDVDAQVVALLQARYQEALDEALAARTEAVSALDSALATAEDLLASSEGKVADNATRDALAGAIASAKAARDADFDEALISGVEESTAAIVAATNGLSGPSTKVTESVAAKAAADRAAAEAAARQSSGRGSSSTSGRGKISGSNNNTWTGSRPSGSGSSSRPSGSGTGSSSRPSGSGSSKPSTGGYKPDFGWGGSMGPTGDGGQAPGTGDCWGPNGEYYCGG